MVKLSDRSRCNRFVCSFNVATDLIQDIFSLVGKFMNL